MTERKTPWTDSVDGRTPEGCALLVNDPAFSHTRMGSGLWREVVWIYHRAAESPTGVLCVGSTREAILMACRRPAGSAPLSPTEPR
jgi:hypothetical protein